MSHLILFDKPFKAELVQGEDKVTITGVCKYFDSYLVYHSSGLTDIKWMPGEVVEMIKEKLKEINA